MLFCPTGRQQGTSNAPAGLLLRIRRVRERSFLPVLPYPANARLLRSPADAEKDSPLRSVVVDEVFYTRHDKDLCLTKFPMDFTGRT